MTGIVPTLILSTRHTPDAQRLWAQAVKQGWNVRREQWGSLPDAAVQDPEASRFLNPPVIYGESIFGMMTAAKNKVSLISPPDDFLCNLPIEFTRRWVFRTLLKHALDAKFPAFVKPSEEKYFKAAVYQSPEELGKAVAAYEPDLPVLVSGIVDFEVEYRCFVAGQVETSSIYIRNGELAEGDGSWDCDERQHNEAKTFAYQVLRETRTDYHLPMVLDVGKIRGRGQGWAVVEANPAWASGLCGCNERRVLDVLRRCTVPILPPYEA